MIIRKFLAFLPFATPKIVALGKKKNEFFVFTLVIS